MFEIGASLREARARRQLGYEQVEAETKIRAKYIRCLEDEQFETLPSGTYVKGFLRTYADYLGLDGQLYVDEYTSRFGTLHDDLPFQRRRERPPARRESSNAALVALAGIVAVSVLFFVAWKFGAPERSAPLPTGPPTTPIKNPALSQATTQHHSQATTGTRTGTTTVAPPKHVTLRIIASGPSWVQVTRIGATKPLLSRIVQTGETVGGGKLADRHGFVILAGVPQYLTIYSNGKRFTLTGTGRERLTASGLVGEHTASSSTTTTH